MFKSEIIGVGSYLPSKVVTNHDLEKLIDTSDEWIVKRTGISQRCWVTENDCTSSMAYEASLKAIKNAGISKNEIDLIIFATISPDHDFPGAGCFLQKRLELPGVPALDIRQQCTGFIYGLSIADSFIACGKYQTILLVGAEVHSKGLDISTKGRDIAVLFGDGAGAVIVKRADSSSNSKIIDSKLYAEGEYAKELWMAVPGTDVNGNSRITKEMIDEGLHFPQMNGKKVYVHAVKRMCEVITTILKDNGFGINDVDLFLFHQANLRINEAIADSLNIDRNKVFNTIQNYGNTTAATIPIGMNDAIAAGKLRKGMLVATVAFGSGFTWGANLIRF